MLHKLFKLILIFIAISFGVLIATQYFNVELGSENYWDHHGLFFLVFLATFPRLTLLFSNVVSGGLLWWLGFIFAPRVLVATLATLAYWQQNPILVTIAWLVAVGGESSEKYIIVKRSRRGARFPQNAPAGEVIDIKPIERN